MKNYEYEEDLDILYIKNNFNNEKVVGNLVFGSMIIDIGESGKVLGIEIDCASKLFSFPAEQLNKLEIAKIQVMRVGNMLTLGIVLATQIKEHTFQFVIPQETSNVPIVC
ncbi:MAG: DUF2283 domain-containing protein [Candidatus Pacearchaeota archaeon]|jgi:uncharacterized protein YuzE